jgi:hypothetical protein
VCPRVRGPGAECGGSHGNTLGLWVCGAGAFYRDDAPQDEMDMERTTTSTQPPPRAGSERVKTLNERKAKKEVIVKNGMEALPSHG